MERKSSRIKGQGMKRLMVILLVSAIMFSAVLLDRADATPQGPTASYVKNETYSPAASLKDNTTGGSITTMVLNGTTQNVRWKAYVGNVSGSLTLDNSKNQTLFDWEFAEMTGEVYATRKTSSVSWSDINCSWGVTGDPGNRNVSEKENMDINHTSGVDNISATFDTRKHEEFYVGSIYIPADTCYSTTLKTHRCRRPGARELNTALVDQSGHYRSLRFRRAGICSRSATTS